MKVKIPCELFISAAFWMALCGGAQQAWAAIATTTTLAVTSGGSPVTTVTSGSVVTLTATVTSGAGTVNAGSVTFAVFQSATQVGSSVISGTVNGGNASASFVGSSGESVGNLRVSALGLNEEAVELAAGGVEGALLVFPAVVDQRAAVLMDHVADKLCRRSLSQSRLFVHVADNLPAE